MTIENAIAPCIAVVGPANAGKTTLLHQLDRLLQRELKAFLVIPGNPDHGGRYVYYAPHQREDLKSHVKGSWTESTADHICASIECGRRNLELAFLDFGGKHDPANRRMLEKCSHYIVVSRLNDDAGGASWDSACQESGLERIAWIRSVSPDAGVEPFVAPVPDGGWTGAFRYDAVAGDTFNDAALAVLSTELLKLRRAPDSVPYIDLHDTERWQPADIPDVRGRAAGIREMVGRTGVVVLGGVAPVWAYLAGLRCALLANPDARVFFFDPQQPDRLVEIPAQRTPGIFPAGVIEVRWTTTPEAARLEFHLTTKDRFLSPAAAKSLGHAPDFGAPPPGPVCLWGRSPTWIYGTYARWLVRTGVERLSSFDAGLDHPVEIWT